MTERPPAPNTGLMREMAGVCQRLADIYALDALDPDARKTSEANAIMARTWIAAADYIDAVKAEDVVVDPDDARTFAQRQRFFS